MEEKTRYFSLDFKFHVSRSGTKNSCSFAVSSPKNPAWQFPFQSIPTSRKNAYKHRRREEEKTKTWNPPQIALKRGIETARSHDASSRSIFGRFNITLLLISEQNDPRWWRRVAAFRLSIVNEYCEILRASSNFNAANQRRDVLRNLRARSFNVECSFIENCATQGPLSSPSNFRWHAASSRATISSLTVRLHLFSEISNWRLFGLCARLVVSRTRIKLRPCWSIFRRSKRAFGAYTAPSV